MTPNNNLSVLPWYTAKDQQNARKWWINKVYPLFTPATHILPFQIMRESRTKIIYEPGTALQLSDSDTGYITYNGDWYQDLDGYRVNVYENLTVTQVYLENCPPTADIPDPAQAVAFNSAGKVIGFFESGIYDDYYNGVWNLPTGTTKIYVMAYNANVGTKTVTVSTVKTTTITLPLTKFDLYKEDGDYEDSLLEEMKDAGLTIKPFANYDVIVFPDDDTVMAEIEDGRYYAELSDGVETWYSEVFTVVNDISPYLKLQWWDVSDFVMDAGTIVYENPTFKNVLYLPSDVAKPEYNFEDETEDRDGYTFPTKQISTKVYHFSFLAPEYLLDVMRFIRMADFVRITRDGQTYTADTFLITPEWEDNGDVASVDAEFTTDTVAKKIGLAYMR